jgi:hypothetical protein
VQQPRRHRSPVQAVRRRELRSLGFDVSDHALHFGCVGVLGRVLPKPARSLIAALFRREGVVDDSGDGWGFASFDKPLSIGGHCGINGDSEPCLPVAASASPILNSLVDNLLHPI